MGANAFALIVTGAVLSVVTGTVNLSKLPDSMTILSLGNNGLEGSPDLATLNPHLQQLFLSGNRFTNPLTFSHLAHGFQILYVDGNEYRGRLPSLKELPTTMQLFSLMDNNFCGSTTFEKNQTTWCPNFDVRNVCANSVSAMVDCEKGILVCSSC